MTRIFISHSHKDRAIATALVDYLLAALTVKNDDVRCTSVPGFMFDPGVNIETQLKNDIQSKIALIALLTKNALRSQWVLFELGAAWGGNKLVIPILGPGVTSENVPGPLKNNICVSVGDENVTYVLNDMIEKLTNNFKGIEERHERHERNFQEAKRGQFIDRLKGCRILEQDLQEINELLTQENHNLSTKLDELKTWKSSQPDFPKVKNLVTELVELNENLNEWKVLHKIFQTISIELLGMKASLIENKQNQNYNSFQSVLNQWNYYEKQINSTIRVIRRESEQESVTIKLKTYLLSCQNIGSETRDIFGKTTSIRTKSRNIQYCYSELTPLLTEILKLIDQQDQEIQKMQEVQKIVEIQEMQEKIQEKIQEMQDRQLINSLLESMEELEKPISFILSFLDDKIERMISDFKEKFENLQEKVNT